MKKGISLIGVLVACFIVVALVFSISYALGIFMRLEKRAINNLNSYLLAEEEMEKTKRLEKDVLIGISGKSFGNKMGNVFTKKFNENLIEIEVLCHTPDGRPFKYNTVKYFEK